MKRFCALLLAALMMLTSIAGALASTKYTHRDDGGSVPVYNEAGEKIFTIPNHTAVESHKKGHGTRYVTYKGKTGWTHNYYLVSEKPKSTKSSKSSSSSSSSSSKKNTSSKTSGKSSSSTAAQENVFLGMKSVNHYNAYVRPSTISNYVNMRWAPSKSSAVHGVYYYGDTLRVIAENKTWAQVVDDSTGKCGYMMKSFLERE